MNSKERAIPRHIVFCTLFLIIFAGIVTYSHPQSVTAKNEMLASVINLELENDMAHILACLGCEDMTRLDSASGILEYYQYTPLAVDIHSNESVNLFIKTDSSVTDLVVELLNGDTVAVNNLGNDSYQVTFSHAQVTYGYLAHHNHSAFGRLHIYQGGTLWGSLNLMMNVIDGNVPSVSPSDVAADARVAPHLVNLHMPDVTPGDLAGHAAIANRFYQLFPDQFDFLNIIYADNIIQNRTHSIISNDVQGIGLSLFDASGAYGSNGKLLGINNFPINAFFDLAERGAVHEIGHQWINTAISEGSPHWPISTMAQGIMGFNIPGTNVGGDFPWALTPDGNGNYQVTYDGDLVNARGFTDLDLYLMGLLPPEEVQAEILFQNQGQSDQLHYGGVLMGPVQQVNAYTVIALHGERVPRAGNAQTHYRVASIIVSRDRLLTPAEMSLFDYMAARSETKAPLPYQVGFATGTTIPFYLATHCRATLSSQVVNTNQMKTDNSFAVYENNIFLPITAKSGCR